MFSDLSKRDIWLCIFAIEWNFASYQHVAEAVETWSDRSTPLLDHFHRRGVLTDDARQALDDLMHNRPTTLVLPRAPKTTIRDLRRVNELKTWSANHKKRSLEDTAIAK